jgi:polyisoprenoid-binding protein YceI
MKSLLIFTIALFITIATFGQDKLTTKSGVLKFEASTENFEPVKAVNKTTSAILKLDGTIAVLGLIKGFQFNKKLMQEHFNQAKFMDSKNFPKTKFSGNLVDFNGDSGEYEINGKLTIHGVTNKVKSKAIIKNIDGVTYLNTKFSVIVADYGIDIQSKLAKKIAEKVNIEVNLELK